MKRTVIIGLLLLVGFVSGYVSSYMTLLPASGRSMPSDRTIVKQVVPNNKTVQIKKLQDDIDEANRYIAHLLEVNNKLSSTTSDRHQTDKINIDPVKISNQIDALPESFLAYQLEKILGDDILNDIEDTRLFSKKALEIALNNSEISAEDATGTILLSTSPVPGVRGFSGNADVERYDIIFAHIQTENALGQLLVKWQNTTTGQILLFNKRSITSRSNIYYVSFRPSAGWQPGRYRVSIHHLNDSLSPIASNSYTITSVDEGEYDGTGRNEKIIQEMLNSGQAVQKQ